MLCASPFGGLNKIYTRISYQDDDLALQLPFSSKPGYMYASVGMWTETTTIFFLLKVYKLFKSYAKKGFDSTISKVRLFPGKDSLIKKYRVSEYLSDWLMTYPERKKNVLLFFSKISEKKHSKSCVRVTPKLLLWKKKTVPLTIYYPSISKRSQKPPKSCINPRAFFMCLATI